MSKSIKSLFLASALIFSHAVFASTSSDITAVSQQKAQEMNLTKKGSVSVSGVRGGPEDATSAIEMKVSDQGGKYYSIVALDTPSDSTLWRGYAIYY